MKKFLAGTLFGILLGVGALLGWRALEAQRKRHATSRVINEQTKAREIRELKPGRETEQRFTPMHVERH